MVGLGGGVLRSIFKYFFLFNLLTLFYIAPIAPYKLWEGTLSPPPWYLWRYCKHKVVSHMFMAYKHVWHDYLSLIQWKKI